MPSDLTQIFPIVAGQIVHSSSANSNIVKSATTPSAITPKDISQLNQVIASQAAASISFKSGKEQDVQIPKRAEPNFQTNEDSSSNKERKRKDKDKKKDKDNCDNETKSLDITA